MKNHIAGLGKTAKQRYSLNWYCNQRWLEPPTKIQTTTSSN
ncbi:hypothetical protein O9992_29010 [Vibrio lentus]|nr:hypothetical protein [Vibrio lentus]